MSIENLAELKEMIADKKEFRIIDHHRIERIGHIEKPNVVQDDGFYAIRPLALDSRESQVNNGQGVWLDYGDATDWEFNDDVCTLYTHPLKTKNSKFKQVIMSFVFLEDKNICCGSCKHMVLQHEIEPTCAKLNKLVTYDHVCEQYRAPSEKTKFTMLIGIPFSGKTAWAKTQEGNDYSQNIIQKEHDTRILSQIEKPEIFEQLYRTMRSDLQSGRDVIFNAMNLTIKERKLFLDQIQNLDVQKTAVVMSVKLSESVQRCDESGNIIDKKMLHELYHQFEQPKKTEGFDQVYYFHEGRLKL